MAAFNHLGLFPRSTPCPRQEDLLYDLGLTDIWISSSPAFLYACAHYWRVKTWRVSVDATWKEVNAGDIAFSSSTSDLISQGIERNYYTYSSPPEEDDSSGTTPASESELICDQEKSRHSLFRYNEVGSGGSATAISYEYDYYAGDGNAPALFRLDGSGNVAEVKTPFYFAGQTTRWNFNTYSFAGNTGTYGTFTYTLLGQHFTTPIYAVNELGDGSLSISISLVAEEYWPYDPGDGEGPIYDSATGAQLRAFP
jgi:hypothetical protein